MWDLYKKWCEKRVNLQDVEMKGFSCAMSEERMEEHGWSAMRDTFEQGGSKFKNLRTAFLMPGPRS